MTKRVTAGVVALTTVPAFTFAAIQSAHAVTGPAATESAKNTGSTVATSETMAACDKNQHGQYGWGCFYPHGDKMKVHDTLLDGSGVVVHWKTSYGREGLCSADGADYAPKVCNYNMREGETIRFRVELWDEGEAHGWNGWEYTKI